jgi:ABC-2 type transport system ATP-binding protein
MSIKVSNLTKTYGSQNAVNNISFEIGKGEIVGFLGPNGAGKSTTMKIATCYLPPGSGIVEVCGFNVQDDPIKAKKLIGYLPEHNPLYLDMYVHEYLEFAGKLHGLRGSALKNAISKMISLCGLTVEQNKKIESLSKGYRQRVGLAQALIHDPEVLILDEPTTGLDPNQLVEIRNLIKQISKNKTLVFSTHIMQEVQALCSRVIVINNGNIVADDELGNLKNTIKSFIKIVAEFTSEVDINGLLAINGVTNVRKTGNNTYELECGSDTDIRPDVFRFASSNNLSLIGLKQEEVTMENVFQNLTKLNS